MHIVLGVTGGIAAYKAPDVVRRLRDVGADVRVILTPNAARFVSPLSLAVVSDHGVIIEQWGDSGHGGVDHIELARWADLLLIAPATANIIAKLAVGLADDALSTYAIAHRGTIVVAPAMNTSMLRHPTVQMNLATLRERGVIVLDPDSGMLACGDEGSGRMPDPPVLADFVKQQFATRDLEGRSILVTAGPTREPIDPVRYISNRSSGKMGYAIAEAARRRGAKVMLVSGPTAITPPAGVAVTHVTTTAEMHRAVMDALPSQQIVIKAAAVADFTPVSVADSKIKKRDELTLTLAKTPDIVADIGASSPRPFIVAFAAETDDLESNAREKLVRKNADLIVANDVADATIGFDSDQNAVTIIARDGSSTKIERAPKIVIANRILDLVVERLGS
ncbi:MAG TPA: bifunctional phosphopantothenoylcysteine decarboxylase/phosphopantothenate--cysteine ligase CoaBC [Thermoanaerobaculia bacterium]|jgi:phosphopantothenoylcysteine decarboxylase/phosphopantothenate--cysteine ligase|nr:bifunctional phosphopantothenoylcysteine decarboxylase/phosphopantothenate--cysteine ligase CoaBC [Thermoanaerobaculia bacterium]